MLLLSNNGATIIFWSISALFHETLASRWRSWLCKLFTKRVWPRILTESKAEGASDTILQIWRPIPQTVVEIFHWGSVRLSMLQILLPLWITLSHAWTERTMVPIQKFQLRPCRFVVHFGLGLARRLLQTWRQLVLIWVESALNTAWFAIFQISALYHRLLCHFKQTVPLNVQISSNLTVLQMWFHQS